MQNNLSDATTSTLARGLKVLEIIAEANQKNGITLNDASKLLGVHRSNVYRYLTTLTECGWVIKDEETFRYRIGHKALQVAGVLLQELDLRKVAQPFLHNLAEVACMTVHLGVLYENSVIYIDKIESNSPIQMRSRPGMVVPTYCTAMGKALLATMGPQTVHTRLAGNIIPHTAHTHSTINSLLTDLAKIRARGYSVDLEENEEGISCVGAVIFDYDDQAIGAISLSAPSQILTQERIPILGEQVKSTAAQISQSMGCHHDHWS